MLTRFRYFSIVGFVILVILITLLGVFNSQITYASFILISLGTMTVLAALYAALFFMVRRQTNQISRQLSQNEAALHQSEARFHQIVSLISDYIYITKLPPEGQPINHYLSPNLEILTGYPLEKLMTDWNFWSDKLVHFEDRPLVDKKNASLVRGQDSEVEYRLIRADGSEIWVRDHGHVEKISTDHGRLVYGVLNDITERKQAEDTFWESARRFRSLIQNASEVIVILDADGVFRYSSPSTLRILGYESADIIGKPIFELIHPDDTALFSETVQEVLQESNLSIPIAECRIRHRDSSWCVFATTFTNLFDTPTVNGLLLNCLDITKRKQAEEVVHKQEEQLRQAQKMEAVGQLAGGIAHDFNNILTAIIGYTELVLNDTAPNNPRYTDLLKIRQSADRATSLTRQLLAFSRKQMLQPRILDLNVVVADISKMLQRLIGEDIELVLRLNLKQVKVNVDLSQLEQVIMNLCLNARDAMPEGGKITIETANTYLNEAYTRTYIDTDLRPGAYVLLAVSDTGVGIDEETQTHIFEPFFTTKRPGIGTGLGLATVYGIVKQSGGHIQVHSEIGQGTTFKIYLPQVEGKAESTNQAVRRPTPYGAETILVVEDQDAIRDLIHRTLSVYGYQVLLAHNGAEALEICKTHPKPIQLILTDVVMPNMSGKVLVEHLLPLRPDIKVLYMSGYTDQAIVHHGVLSQDAPFIHKPFSPVILADKIRQLLDKPVE